MPQARRTSAEPASIYDPGPYTAAELMTAGYGGYGRIGELMGAADLKSFGYTVAQFKAAGFAANTLRMGGYTIGDLIAGGFSFYDQRSYLGDITRAGYKKAEFTTAGYTATDLKQNENNNKQQL